MLRIKNKHLAFSLASMLMVIVLVACKSGFQHKEILIESFKLEALIEGEQLILDENLIEGNFWLIDSLLVIKSGIPGASFLEEDYQFYFYDKNTLSRIGHFGKPGRGPGELIDPRPTGQFVRTDTGTIMVVYLPQNRKLIGVNINGIIDGQTEGLVTTLLMMPENLMVVAMYPPLITPKGGVIGTTMGDQGRFFYWDGHKVSFTPFFPESSRIVPTPLQHLPYISNYALSPSNELVVSAMLFWKQIDLFSPEMEHRNSLIFPDSPLGHEIITPEGVPYQEAIAFFVSLHVSDKYIYALHWGNKLYRDDDYKSTIYIFSHSGESVARLEANPRIRYISVDGEDKYLYGSYYDDNEEVVLVRFELPFR